MLDLILLVTLPFLSSPLGIVVYIIGFIAAIIMILWVPIRIVWIVFASFSYKKIRDRKKYLFSVLLLILSIIPIIEFFLTAKNGTSGLFLFVVCPVPLFIYMSSEYFRYESYNPSKTPSQIRDDNPFIYDDIKHILTEKWDPFIKLDLIRDQLLPTTNLDDYIPTILDLSKANNSSKKITDYLTKSMKGNPRCKDPDIEFNKEIASQIISIIQKTNLTKSST